MLLFYQGTTPGSRETESVITYLLDALAKTRAREARATRILGEHAAVAPQLCARGCTAEAITSALSALEGHAAQRHE